ncbi:MAG TPA: flagellar filament capping protein FliD, partial [Casimicrobiaceae bacterium]|nr:flagellar filament capping protein FliD [Casimicrobiaceae bacterium]
TQLDTQQAVDQAKITAYGTLKSALSALQSAVQSLASPATFQTITATSSNPSALTVSVSGKPVAGTYSIAVDHLAQTQKLSSGGFAATSTVIGTGALTFDFGTYDGTANTFTSSGKGLKTVAIGAGQNTLSGIRDAVNAAGIGVTATIVNDGTAAGNHLVFTSTSGAANSVKLTVADDDGNNTDLAGLSQLAYDPTAAPGAGGNLTEKVAAQDAQAEIDGITVTSATNTLQGTLDGLTINLLGQTTANATISVAPSTSNVDASVNAFVKAYNDLTSTITNLTKYDATNKQASTLTGDATARTIQNQLRTLLGGKLGNGTYSTLSQVGISFQTDGTLKLDSTKLDAALAASPSAVSQLFASGVSATDPLVGVAGFSSKTVAGTYGLNVGQLATQGSLLGSGPAQLTIDPTANSVTVTLDGITADVAITPGTYADTAALAAEVQTRINGTAAFSQAGASVTVSAVNDQLNFATNRYGSAYGVNISGPNAAVLLGPWGGGTQTAGVDASATLGGIALAGSGQTLTAPAGSVLDSMVLTINGGATGARGNVTYSAGFASRLNDLLTQVLDSDGSIQARTDGLQSEITDIGKRRDALNTHLALVEQTYRTQFNALDTLLSNLQAQSAALTQQLASLPKIT